MVQMVEKEGWLNWEKPSSIIAASKVSPSPGGEGRDEGELNLTNVLLRRLRGLERRFQRLDPDRFGQMRNKAGALAACQVLFHAITRERNTPDGTVLSHFGHQI